MASTTSSISIKVDPKIGVGLSTAIGVGAAVVQFLGTVALLVQDGTVNAEDFAPLVTGVATLIAVIQSRGKQAAAAISAKGAPLSPPLISRAGHIGHEHLAPPEWRTEPPSSGTRSSSGVAANTTNGVSAGERILGEEPPEPDEVDTLSLEAAEEADGDQYLEPDYPGRASEDATHAEQVAARLANEQRGDACAPVPEPAQGSAGRRRR